jgi:hypothetical protein
MSVVRSASCLMTALALTVLTGCDSTQQQAARARLKALRVLASASPTVVRKLSPDVRVVAVTLLRGSAGDAITVRLHSSATRPLNDLPISVGTVTHGGRRSYLNAAANVPYFKTHIASIGARASVTWVFTTPRELPASATAFAAVGARASVPPTAVRALPRIEIAEVKPATAPSRGPRVRFRVTNASAVPQYQLQVYAVGLERGRFVAAGRATVNHLGTGNSQLLEISLIGGRGATAVELEALPTMFQ